MSELYLEHYGVKGMKWGVRKKKDRGPDSEDYSEAQELLKKSLSSLSNAELRKLNDRMSLENKYAELMPPSSVQKNINKGLGYIQTAAKVGMLGVGVYALVKNPSVESGLIFASSLANAAIPNISRNTSNGSLELYRKK